MIFTLWIFSFSAVSTMLMSVLLFLLFFIFIFYYWDLGLMPLSATKRRHPDFNKACNSARLLIFNGLTM